PTHHGLFDIGYLRHIPNFILCQPRDESEFASLLYTLHSYTSGPSAIRYPRGTGTGNLPPPNPPILPIGKAEILLQPPTTPTVTLLALGPMCELATKVASHLADEKIPTAVINARWIKPIDSETILHFAQSTQLLVTIEDHYVINGFGSAVLELLSENFILTPTLRFGWPDQFIEHGALPSLRQKYGLTADAISQKIKSSLQQIPTTSDRKPIPHFHSKNLSPSPT
ncbi:MAG: hypothetical protein N2035_09175, partial [Chthoniobacterales bacterium]|nr:hypothetical protein [Chthoniobacterales bacterium]